MGLFAIFNNLLVVCPGCGRTLRSNIISKAMYDDLKYQINAGERKDLSIVGGNIERKGDDVCKDCADAQLQAYYNQR